MIYVTGDMHGAEDRLYGKERRKLKSGDVLIVCGDFGYIWNGDKFEKEAVEYLGSRKFTVCFVDGTHEPPKLVKSAMLLREGEVDRINKLNGYFEEIDNSCTYKKWYFGSLHEDRVVTPIHTCVFNKIIPLGE